MITDLIALRSEMECESKKPDCFTCYTALAAHIVLRLDPIIAAESKRSAYRYTIVEGNTIIELANIVRGLIEAGYQPQGGIGIEPNGKFYQALVYAT